MENKAIRDAARTRNIKLWEIAQRLNISDGNFSRRLRRQLNQEETARILAIIDEISAEHLKKEGKK